jgi:glycosyltransferase involved in cell wall biosynthesis
VKVAFVVPDTHLSGGIGTVAEHARRLRFDHGFDVSLVLDREMPGQWTYEQLEGVPLVRLSEAQQHDYDVVVATWWETTYALFTLRSARYAYFVQSLEDRFFPREHMPQQLGAGLTYGLPVSFITEARWIQDTLRALRPDASCYLVRNGIDKANFTIPDEVDVRLDGPLRIVVEGRPSVWFKGVPEALESASRMQAPHEVTVVAADRSGLPRGGYDRVLGPLTHRELAGVYSQTDVLLKLSRVEGMFGPPLEAFHRGATCVVTPVTGHEEYVAHGWNGLVVDWDDMRGTARMLDLIARDRRLLHFLRTNAVATARGWPSWDQSTQFMAAVLETIRARPAEGTQAAGFRLASDFRTALETYALERRARRDLAFAAATLSWAPPLFHALVARRWVRTLARPARPLYRRLRVELERRALDQ